MVDVFCFGPYGDVACRDAIRIGDIVSLAVLGHLLLEAFGGVHPLHHEVYLFLGDDVLISGGECFLSHFFDEGDILGGGLAYGYHVLVILIGAKIHISGISFLFVFAASDSLYIYII